MYMYLAGGEAHTAHCGLQGRPPPGGTAADSGKFH